MSYRKGWNSERDYRDRVHSSRDYSRDRDYRDRHRHKYRNHTRGSDCDRDRDRHWKHESHRNSHRDHHRSSHKKRKRQDDDDDSIGHYEGRKGDTIKERYLVRKEAGVGTFGRVLECWDHRKEKTVAIKVVRNIRKYTDSAAIEADILRDVNKHSRATGASPCVALYDDFKFSGHFCLVFESLSDSLYDMIKANDYKPFPLNYVLAFTQQMLEAVEFLHDMKLIHTDLKPENVLVVSRERCVIENDHGARVSVPTSPQIKVIDFGGATYDDDDHKSSIVNTRQYRAPEVILNLGWSMPSDLWSVGCIAAELYKGELLFSTHNNTEHLALMEGYLGPFPTEMVAKSSVRKRYFDMDEPKVCTDGLSRDSQRHVRKMPSLKDFTAKHEDEGLFDLFECLLKMDPHQRATPAEALQQPAFQHAVSGAPTNQSNGSRESRSRSRPNSGSMGKPRSRSH